MIRFSYPDNFIVKMMAGTLEVLNCSWIETINKNYFSNCPLSSVKLSNIETLGSKAFYGCSSLRNVEIGNKIESIASDTFGSCDSVAFKIHKSQGAITGYPWGATNSTIEWLGE